MYAQHVRKWSLKTQPQLMPLISLAFYVSTMLLLITCATTTTTTAAAAAAATTITQRQQLQQQRSWESEESSYYIALPQQQQQQQQQQLADNGSGSSESVGSNIDNNILSRLLKRPSNSLSSTSNIKLRPATVFDAPVQQQQQQQQKQHIAAVTTQQSQQQVPNTLINSQIYKLLYNGIAPSVTTNSKTRRHAHQQQQLSSNAALQQAATAAHNNTATATSTSTQRYLIESYEVPESRPDPTSRNRRDFGNSNTSQQRQHRSNVGGNHRKQQQQDRREERSHRQKQRQQSLQRRKHPNKRRRYKQPYCSAHDPAQLAYVAPTVFRGVFTSMTADRKANFSATMKVLEVYKHQRDLQLPQLVRLQFALTNNSGECDIYQEQLLPRGLVRRNKLEQSSDISYMMFVQQTNPGNFSILGQPKRVTDRVIRSVERAVNETYAQNASIKSIRWTSSSGSTKNGQETTPSNATMQNGDELRIICEVRGEPPPKVTWFKDDKSINRKRHVYKFNHFKKRSELIVRSFNGSTDAGKYECRAKNKASKTIDKRRIMINAHLVPMRPDQHSMGYGYPCELENICFHGGKCMIIPDLTQFYCNCPEGFNGVRCEYTRPDSTYSNNPECGDKYYGGYYC